MRRLAPAIALLSAAALGYEILLMRLFSIVQWHHFAYMIISLALLGYGASGTVIALARGPLLAHFRAAFAAGAAGFGLTAVGGFALAQRLPFNPLELMWDARQPLWLLAVYLILAVPFLCAATSLGLAFTRHASRVGPLYRADLVGAGAGAAAMVLLLFAVRPERALTLLGATGLLAAALITAGRSRRAVAATALLLAGAAAVVVLWPRETLAPRISPYKGLSQALEAPGRRVIAERSSPLGLLSVVAPGEIPFRHAPGLSLNARTDIPEQRAVFSDGGAMTAITRFTGDLDALAYLDWQGAALPYHLLDRPRVLVLGAGGGADVLRALAHDARRVDAVELNPQMVALVRGPFADFAGRLYAHPRVRVQVAEARGFAARSDERYDLVQLALLDAFSASAAGLHALSESTLYTVEALGTFLDRLAPGGLLAVTRWMKLPPRDSLKLFATAVAALERRGVREPGRRLALVRSWNTTTLLVKRGAITAGDVAAIERFTASRGFDVAWVPGMAPEEANRRNVLARPWLHEGARALLGPEREAFLADYKFHVAPPTDDRPYFFHFFKWRVLPELLALRGAGGLQHLEWGYLVLVATLVQAALVSVAVILLPLGALRRPGPAAPRRQPFGRVAVYFLALGLAFLFIEMAYLQRFALFLSDPLYAAAVVLGAFLVFAGLGSGASARLAARWPGARLPPGLRAPVGGAVAGIVVVGGAYLVALPPLFDALRPLAEPVRVAVSVALIAPLGFCMGLPFPLGLRWTDARAPALVPWAWGINGCASVLSAVLGTLLAIHLGFSVVVLCALALYGVAAAVLRD